MKQLTDKDFEAIKAELAEFRANAAEVGVKKVNERSILNAEGDKLTFKGEKVSDFFKTQTEGTIKYNYFLATNGQQVSESAITAAANNGLELEGTTPEERCEDFIRLVLESEAEGFTIGITRIKSIPTRKIGEQMKQMLFERA